MKFLFEDFADEYNSYMKNIATTFAKQIIGNSYGDAKFTDPQSATVSVGKKVAKGKQRDVIFTVKADKNGDIITVNINRDNVPFFIEDIYRKSAKVAIDVTNQYEEATKAEDKENKTVNKIKTATVTSDEADVDRNSLDYAIGWLAGHMGAFVVSMPPHRVNAFLKAFPGVTEDGYKVVEGRTTGRKDMKWDWSVNIPVAQNCPQILFDYGIVNPNENKITRLLSAFSLVNEFGFWFGRVQDPVEIAKHVKDVDAFWDGYGARVTPKGGKNMKNEAFKTNYFDIDYGNNYRMPYPTVQKITKGNFDLDALIYGEKVVGEVKDVFPLEGSNRRAFVICTDRGVFLQSYNTVVCGIVDGELEKYWNEWSATTMKHINTFLNRAGFQTLNKKSWLAL